VYRPESLVWLEGYQALIRWRAENEVTGLYAVPYDVEVEVGVTKDFPLGRWVHQQRKALRAGELRERRKVLLDAPEAGMVWEPGEEAWENKLAALRSYRRAMGHLAPRQDNAVWGEGEAMVPVGQHMANLRRKGGLGKDTERAAVRAQQLAAVDEDWNCPWPLHWQRRYRVLADLATDEPGGVLPTIAPGVTFDGDDIGRWLQQIAMQWNPWSTGGCHSFANSTRTHEGGAHEQGFRTALTDLVNDYARRQRHLGTDDEDLTIEAIHQGLTAVVSVKLAHPVFEGPTRTKLGNPEADAYVQEVVREHLADWLHHHPDEAAAIIRHTLNAST
jgi:hypothetical protein